MTRLRFARTLIVATSMAVLASGCCVTSLKVRKCQQSAACQTPYESSPLPLPVGTPPTFEAPPAPLPSSSPLPAPAPPPAPASASTLEDFGVKTGAFFRSTGDKLKRTFARS